MKGSIRSRGLDRWQIVLDNGYTANGKRRQVYRTILGPKKAAQSALAALLREIETGTVADAGRTTVGEYVETWLKTMKCRVSANTWDRYDIALRLNVLPAFGGLRLADLRPMHLQTLYSDLLKNGRQDNKGGLSPRSVRHVHVIFGGALREAVRLQLLARNPADAVKPPRVVNPEQTALTEEETLTLINRAKGSRLYIPVLLAAACGLRRGEILALRWSDIDLSARRLTVQRALVRAGGQLVFKEPKSNRSVRCVTLPELAFEALRSYRVSLAAEQLALGGIRNGHDLVCPTIGGSPWHPVTLSDAFRTFLRGQVDLPRARFHDLRHTHATMLIRAGVPAKVVSERLGHTSVAFTLNTYSHVQPGMQEDATAKIDLALGRAQAALQRKEHAS